MVSSMFPKNDGKGLNFDNIVKGLIFELNHKIPGPRIKRHNDPP